MAKLKRILVVILVSLFVFQTNSPAKSNQSLIVFNQVSSVGKTLYLADHDGSNLRPIVTGKEINVFLGKKHFLYVVKGQLFEYLPKQQTIKFLAKFNENSIRLNWLEDGPDQLIIIGENPYETNYYVLDFTDGNLRRLPSNPNTSQTTYSTKISINSPDGKNKAILNASRHRYQISVNTQEKKWELPADMSILPEPPQWSPDSQKIAFYAKPLVGNGFYSLYVVDLSLKKLELNKIQDEVFTTTFSGNRSSGGFKPEWSEDSNYLVFSYLPFGTPLQSSIIQYDLKRKQKDILLTNFSENYYPKYSASENEIIFLSKMEKNQFQLYVISGKDHKYKRISPEQGFTQWAQWFNLD